MDRAGAVGAMKIDIRLRLPIQCVLCSSRIVVGRMEGWKLDCRGDREANLTLESCEEEAQENRNRGESFKEFQVLMPYVPRRHL